MARAIFDDCDDEDDEPIERFKVGERVISLRATTRSSIGVPVRAGEVGTIVRTAARAVTVDYGLGRQISHSKSNFARTWVIYDASNRRHEELRDGRGIWTPVNGINPNGCNTESQEISAMFNTATARTKAGYVGQVVNRRDNTILWESAPVPVEVDGEAQTPEQQERAAAKAAEEKISVVLTSLFA